MFCLPKTAWPPTSLLILVVVTMDFLSQVNNYVMSQQYESLLKKSNFKGGLIQ